MSLTPATHFFPKALTCSRPPVAEVDVLVTDTLSDTSSSPCVDGEVCCVSVVVREVGGVSVKV